MAREQIARASGSLDQPAADVGHDGESRVLEEVTSRGPPACDRAPTAMSGEWNAPATFSRTARSSSGSVPRPPLARSPRRLPDEHDLLRRVLVGDREDVALRRDLADLGGIRRGQRRAARSSCRAAVSPPPASPPALADERQRVREGERARPRRAPRTLPANAPRPPPPGCPGPPARCRPPHRTRAGPAGRTPSSRGVPRRGTPPRSPCRARRRPDPARPRRRHASSTGRPCRGTGSPVRETARASVTVAMPLVADGSTRRVARPTSMTGSTSHARLRRRIPVPRAAQPICAGRLPS